MNDNMGKRHSQKEGTRGMEEFKNVTLWHMSRGRNATTVSVLSYYNASDQ